MSTPTSTPPLSRGSRNSTKRGERTALANVHEHLGDVEKWFIKRGLPHFIEDYKATDDVFNRALPLIVLLIVVQMGFELTSKTVTWQNRGVGAAVGLGAVLVLFLIANLIRQPSAWYKWPKKVGVVEITLLVALGPAVGLAVRARKQAVALDFAANVAVLIIVYALVAYAVLPVILWALKHSVTELGNLVNLASKALPMLALFGTFLFLNVDMWHIASGLGRQRLWQTVGFFAVITFLFLLVRLPEEVRKLRGEYTKESVMQAAADTPLNQHVSELDDDLHPLTTNRRQRINMLFVLAFTQIIQVLLLALVVFVYFITLGKLAVTEEQMADWLNLAKGTDEYDKKIVDAGKLFGFDAKIPLSGIGYHDVVFPDALLQTAILLTTFSAFFFAVSAVTDDAYRKDFFESITGRLTKSLDIRCGYVNLYVKATRNIGPGAGLASDGIGYGFRAEEENRRRTVQVPILDPDMQPPAVPVSSFQPPRAPQQYQPPQPYPPFQPEPGQVRPGQGQFGQPGGFAQQLQIPQQGEQQDPDNPFERWPQQQ